MSSTPTKVVNIIARLNIGGPAVVVSLLTQKLAEPAYPYESLLITGSVEAEEGDMTYYAHEHRVEPIILPEMGRSIHPVRDLRTIWKLYQLLREMKPDVVHTHTSKAGFVGRWAAKFARVPVIVHTFHGHTFYGYFGPVKTRAFIMLEQMTSRITDTIIALTQGLRRDLADVYHITRKEHITVLPLGLDLEPFASLPRKSGAFRRQWNIPQDVPLIGIVGRFVRVKNHALFLKSAALIRQQMPDAHFVLVGDGELHDEILAQIDALGLRDAVTLTGWQKEVAEAYADMDVFVITSVNEGTPVTVIEALATGCPVVTTNVGGLPDLLDGGLLGRLVETENAEAVASGVIETLNNPPDTSVAQRAMIDRYGIDRLVSDLDSLYRGLLARKGRPVNQRHQRGDA
jgi:glycosyltransferase involved in cell wall biosynthesis